MRPGSVQQLWVSGDKARPHEGTPDGFGRKAVEEPTLSITGNQITDEALKIAFQAFTARLDQIEARLPALETTLRGQIPPGRGALG